MSEMDSVNLFNSELSSLYDVKPPISKGKMTAITKAALKAVKLYKHVVQSVEKFIQKCKPEYKIPGLYVIDSIIRQSRHQFGPDKDIFAGRFSRNLKTTFGYLYRCPVEDRAKVIRVLNLWQKNRIFLPEAIQPLMDLADPNNPEWETIQDQGTTSESVGGSVHNNSSSGGHMNNNSSTAGYSSEVQFKTSLLDYDYDEDNEDSGQMSQPSHQQQQQQQQAPVGLTQNTLAGIDALGSILNNPEVLRQLQTLQEQMTAAAQAQVQQQQQQQMGYLTPEQERQRKLAELNKQEAAFDQRLAQTVARLPFAVECGDFTESQEQNKSKSPARATDGLGGYSVHNSVDQNSNQLSSHQNAGLLLPPPFFQHLNPDQLPTTLHQSQQQQQANQSTGTAPNPFGIPLNFPMGIPPPFQHPPEMSQGNIGMYGSQRQNEIGNFPQFNPNQPPPFEALHQHSSNFIEDKDRERRDRDRDRDRERRRRRSGERDKARSGSRSLELSPSKGGRGRHSRSNSRSRSSNRPSKRHDKRTRSSDRKEEKERQRKGFGVMKRDHLSVCSTTLWVGHLSKLVSQEEISDTFGSYGDIVSIDLIQSRGCAFVVMNRRQDACRALDRLKNTKLQGKTITLAWAPGKGVKGRDWKDYWEVEAGISYIPWSKLRLDTDLEEFEDGGCMDETTLPDSLRNKPKKSTEKLDENIEANNNVSSSGTSSSVPPVVLADGVPVLPVVGAGDVDARSEVPPSGVPPPLQPGLPTGVPPPMQNQAFGMPPPLMSVVPPMGLNMMMPPPMMGGPMGLPPQFAGMANMANMQQIMSMMGTHGMNPNLGMPQPLDSAVSLNPLPPPGAGLLGDMPLANQMNNTRNLIINEETDMQDENRKRRPDRRENRERKRSRFDNPDEKVSPPRDTDDRNSPAFRDRGQNQQEDPPLFDRLKSLAEGYGSFGPNSDSMKLQLQNSLLGAPIGPPLGGPTLGGPPRGPGPMPNSHGFPHNMRGGRDQFGGPGPRPPFMGDRPPGPAGPGGPGPRPWFDSPPGSQNPFVNPTQNPFSGNPFIPNATTENPFDIGGGPEPGGNDREFFGNSENQFQNRRGGGPPGPGDGGGWGRDGPGQWGRGRPPGIRGGRGGRGGGPNNWRDEGQEEFMDFRGGFRGGRGGRGRGGRDWDRGEHNDRGGGRGRDRNSSERGGRGDWDRGRDRDRDRDWNRDRDNNRRRRSHSRDHDPAFNRNRPGNESRFSDNQQEKIKAEPKRGLEEEDWNEPPASAVTENWDSEDVKHEEMETSRGNQESEEQQNEVDVEPRPEIPEDPGYEEDPHEPHHHRDQEDSYEEAPDLSYVEETPMEREMSNYVEDKPVEHEMRQSELQPEREDEGFECNLIEAREEEAYAERESAESKLCSQTNIGDLVQPVNGNGCGTNENESSTVIEPESVT